METIRKTRSHDVRGVEGRGAPCVLVVGGGIGGLSTAIALRRAGVDAQVFERAPELREVGAGISIWPNATRILREWGVLDALVARAFVLSRGAILSPSGRLLQEMPFPETDAPHLLVHRAELQAVLAEALAPWVLHLGAEFDPIPRLLEATPDAEVIKGDVCDRPPTRGWGRGRVTLLGDAAHPTTTATWRRRSARSSACVIAARRRSPGSRASTAGSASGRAPRRRRCATPSFA